MEAEAEAEAEAMSGGSALGVTLAQSRTLGCRNAALQARDEPREGSLAIHFICD